MRQLKIAQVITRMDWGGAPDIIRLLCEELSRDNQVKLIIGKSVYVSDKNKQFLAKFKDSIIEVGSLQRDIDIFKDLAALVELTRIFKREQFDLIQANTGKAGFIARIAAYFAGRTKTIYMPHGHLFYGYFGPVMSKFIVLLEKIAGLVTDKIFVLTELEKKDFLTYNIKTVSDIEVIPSGLALEEIAAVDRNQTQNLRQTLGFKQTDSLVGLVSRLEEVKGVQYFIEAAKLVSQQDNSAKFVVAGTGSLLERLKQRVAELKLEETVKFIGWQQDPLTLIAGLDILVQPSLNEAVGRVLLEAQALGVVVVATHVGGVPQVVKDGITGLLVEAGNKQELADSILRLLTNQPLRLEMAQAGKQWVENNFSKQVMINKIKDIYQQLVGEK